MMRTRHSMARTMVTAGLGLAMALEPAARSVALADQLSVGEYASDDYASQAQGESTGDTQLYIISRQDNLTAAEGSADAQLKVSIPVAIHYVADSNGNLVGPSNGKVKFVNHTQYFPVHVSKIAVEQAKAAKIVDKNSGAQFGEDEMNFFVKPVQGQSNDNGSKFTQGQASKGKSDDYVLEGTTDSLGAYANKAPNKAVTPTNKNDWNIAPGNGALALNDLTGRHGGFSQIDASSDYQAGTVHWVVRSGTRAEADKRDASVTIRFHANKGSNGGCEPLNDQTIPVVDISQLPSKIPLENIGDTDIKLENSSVVPPTELTNPDGTTTTWVFSGWYRNPQGTGDKVQKLKDIDAAPEKLAGTIQNLYAVYVEASTAQTETAQP